MSNKYTLKAKKYYKFDFDKVDSIEDLRDVVAAICSEVIVDEDFYGFDFIKHLLTEV